MRAVLAAKHLAAGFDAVADDAALAVRAGRGELLDRALEAVERMRAVAGEGRRESLVVAVAANFASAHDFSLRGAAPLGGPLRSFGFRFVLHALLQERHQIDHLAALLGAALFLRLRDLLGLAGLHL